MPFASSTVVPKFAWDVECAVIGGGPGGLVAALYLGRFMRKTVLINGGKPRAAWIPKTHNLLGFPEGVSGLAVLNRLNRHVAKVGVERLKGTAIVERYHEGFQVRVGSNLLTARKVILATGIEDVHPAIENLAELRDRGLIRYCPICDGYDYRGRQITVLAADDHGVQEAVFISRYTNKLTLVVPDSLILAPQRIRELRAAHIRTLRGRLTAIEPARRPLGLWVCLSGLQPHYARIVYPALGSIVKDQAFRCIRNLRRDSRGFLVLASASEQRLSVPGLFGVGDCVNVLAQISVAAGQGATAAVAVHNDLFRDEV